MERHATLKIMEEKHGDANGRLEAARRFWGEGTVGLVACAIAFGDGWEGQAEGEPQQVRQFRDRLRPLCEIP